MTSKPEMLPFTPHDHDVRVERDGWVFFVRGVKKYEPFRGDATWDGTLSGILFLLIAWSLAHLLWQAQDTWKVGILRYRSSRWGGRIKIVHKEQMPRGEQPYGRIRELVDEVHRGVYDAG